MTTAALPAQVPMIERGQDVGRAMLLDRSGSSRRLREALGDRIAATVRHQ